MINKTNFRDEIPATSAQLRLIAILTAQLRIREPTIKTFGEAGLFIQALYKERRQRNALQNKLPRTKS